MKRIVSIALVILMVASLFVACSGSGSASPEGVYKIKTINGQSMKAYFAEMFGSTEDEVDSLLKLAGIENIDEYMTFTLKKDGVFTATVMGEEETGTWKLDGEKLTLTIEEDPMECTFKNGEITVDMNGEVMVLGK